MTDKLPKPRNRLLSLHPLKFDEAISDLLKIKPEPKKNKRKPPRKQK